ncbi:biopolymer transport protein TolQ [Polymorphobacter multimanifer]|uniref:Tol-Pal system protein TolQ n=2 Tax=Polymorphobacter multimanifer TaxID=1070431 RepID=A0A841LE34_9SPHN|nr:protein TolQ [Polymorphobacter multimanifer]MBB6227422.1 biopolymer transport protein TolQ [Polymorphobacter multimanifer]
MEPVIATATEISPWALFLQADIVVKLVMLGLLMASVWSWAIIFERSRAIRRINREATQFEDWFWKAESLDALFEPATRATHPSARLFVSGMNEWRRSLARGRFDREGIRTRLASTTQVSIGREIDTLGDRLNILATIGAVAPFVGLFGTVWGIMRSFTAIAASQNTTLAVVAPGIAEALFATALGLFAAIPAVIGYNRLLHGVGRLEARLGAFAEEFQGLLGRQLDSMDSK